MDLEGATQGHRRNYKLRSMGKQNVASHREEYRATVTVDEVLTQAVTWMNLENLMLVKETTKDHILYESTYMKRPEWANPKR